MSFSRLLIVAILSIGLTTIASAAPQNIARLAKISADSQHSSPYAVAFVADGKIPKVGGCNGAGSEWAAQGNSHRDGVTVTFQWAEAMTVAEIVYYARTSYAVEGFKDYEVYIDTTTKPVIKGQLKCGHGPQRI